MVLTCAISFHVVVKSRRWFSESDATFWSCCVVYAHQILWLSWLLGVRATLVRCSLLLSLWIRQPRILFWPVALSYCAIFPSPVVWSYRPIVDHWPTSFCGFSLCCGLWPQHHCLPIQWLAITGPTHTGVGNYINILRISCALGSFSVLSASLSEWHFAKRDYGDIQNFVSTCKFENLYCTFQRILYVLIFGTPASLRIYLAHVATAFARSKVQYSKPSKSTFWWKPYWIFVRGYLQYSFIFSTRLPMRGTLILTTQGLRNQFASNVILKFPPLPNPKSIA